MAFGLNQEFYLWDFQIKGLPWQYLYLFQLSSALTPNVFYQKCWSIMILCLVNILQFSIFIAREWLIIKGFLYENDDYHIISNANGVIKYSCDNFFCMYTKRVSNKKWNVMPIFRVIFTEDHILIWPDRSLLLGR